MSSLWTPEGEHRVPRDEGGSAATPSRPAGDHAGGAAGGAGAGRDDAMVDRDAVNRQVEEMRHELASTPAEVVVANHCYGLFELAAVYLSQDPPLIDQARLAIDAFGAVVDGLHDRLGEAEPSLRDGLSQIRLAYVELDRARSGAASGAGDNPPGGSTSSSDGPSDGRDTEASPTT